MSKIHVNNEIGKLKTVLLHEPGEELHNLTPKHLDDLLFDDIPWLPLAKKEHQAFAKTFTDNGIKVVYLVDLVAEAIDTDIKVKEAFINQFVKEANINSVTLSEVVIDFLKSIKDTKEMGRIGKIKCSCINGGAETEYTFDKLVTPKTVTMTFNGASIAFTKK